jgi:hypothetical protein
MFKNHIRGDKSLKDEIKETLSFSIDSSEGQNIIFPLF